MIQENDLLAQLRATLSQNGHEALAGALVAHDAAGFVADTPAMQAVFDAQTPILLRDVSAAQKELLTPHLGTRLEGNSDYLFVLTQCDDNGAPCFYIADMGDGNVAFPAEAGSQDQTGDLNPPRQPDETPDEAEGLSRPAVPLDSEALRYQSFCAGAVRILSAVDGSNIPADAVYATWYFNQPYDWACGTGNEHHGFTPQPQATYGTVDYKLQAFLDEPASGNAQWVFVQALGFWSVGASGMNYDDYNQKGWAIGTVGLQVAQPGGFNTIQQSPVNTNKQTSVTTGSSFQVSMSKSSAGGSYTVSNSETTVLSDWSVTLDDLNKWTYRQSNKFDGTTQKFPKSEVHYSSSNARYDLHTLPDLSKKVVNFCTMSVFRNSRVQTGIVKFTCAVECQYFYMAIKTKWPNYKGAYWYTHYKPIIKPLSIDLTLVSQPKAP